jgi:hypothetical protein
MNIWLKRGLFALGGAAAGFAWYYVVGCRTGSCPITSDPYASSAYGALVGLVATIGGTRKGPTSP